MADTIKNHQTVKQRLESVLNASNSTMAEGHLRVVEDILAQSMNPSEYDETIAVLDEHDVPCARLKRARELISSILSRIDRPGPPSRGSRSARATFQLRASFAIVGA
jgi:crotonobetainyl-CoA:carnitine CoA-transferase CaiB-like acyl-CoA transferase